MISLSDFKPLKPREIKLKPIQFKVAEKKIADESQLEQNDALSEVDQLLERKKQLLDELAYLKTELKTTKDTIELNRKRADEDIEQAKTTWISERELLEEAAQQKGFQEGYIAGENQAQVDFKERINLANDIIHQAEKERELIIEQANQEIVELSMAVAKKVVFDAVLTKDAMLPIVKEAIKTYHNQTIIRIRTSVTDFELIHSQTDELARVLNEGVMLSVLPDDSLSTGGCVIETPSGQLDISVDRQLEKIHQTLSDTMEEMNRGH
ncbi:Flagellar assembly protein FliH [Halolactibacillus alkaliphilus]|nr:Flagellar assembly protein FliH [Halolactibacillus alkaliphilus]